LILARRDSIYRKSDSIEAIKISAVKHGDVEIVPSAKARAEFRMARRRKGGETRDPWEAEIPNNHGARFSSADASIQSSDGRDATADASRGARRGVIFPGKDKSGKGAVAYVVPDDEYAQRTFADTEEERKRVQRWRKAFDLSQLVRATEPACP